MMWIKDFKDGQKIKGQYLVSNVSKGVTATNSNYLNVTLQDKTGSIEAKVWDAQASDEQLFAVGNVLEIIGDILNYRNNLQMKIQQATYQEQSLIDPSMFTMSAPTSISEMEVELTSVIESIKDEQIRLLVQTLLNKYYQAYINYPAAVRIHHEYTGGLLYHTLSMARLANSILNNYPHLNRDLLIAGVLLHDLGKTIELSGPIVPKYTVKGKLIGHISLMNAEIMNVGQSLNIDEEIITLIAHMVLSHHGKQEYGSPIIPLTQEALLLSLIDDMDSKVIMAEKALVGVEPGEFSGRIFALDDRSLYLPKYGSKKEK